MCSLQFSPYMCSQENGQTKDHSSYLEAMVNTSISNWVSAIRSGAKVMYPLKYFSSGLCTIELVNKLQANCFSRSNFNLWKHKHTWVIDWLWRKWAQEILYLVLGSGRCRYIFSNRFSVVGTPGSLCGDAVSRERSDRRAHLNSG